MWHGFLELLKHFEKETGNTFMTKPTIFWAHFSVVCLSKHSKTSLIFPKISISQILIEKERRLATIPWKISHGIIGLDSRGHGCMDLDIFSTLAMLSRLFMISMENFQINIFDRIFCFAKDISMISLHVT